MRFAGLAHPVEVAVVFSALPGGAAVIGIDDAGQLVAGAVVIEGEDNALCTIVGHSDATARADAGEFLIGGGLDVQELGLAPLQARVGDLGGAVHDVEHRVDLPLTVLEEQVLLHPVGGVAQLGDVGLGEGAVFLRLDIHIQVGIHPGICGGAVLAANGVEDDIFAVVVGGLCQTVGVVQIHIVGVRRNGLGGIGASGSLGHQQAALIVKTGALLAHLIAAHQAHVRGAGIHHHVDGAVAVLDDGGINEGAAGVAGGGFRHVGQVVHHFPLPSLAVVLGDADNGVQVLGRVTAGGPADVRGGHDPAVVQGVQRGDAEMLASGGLTAEGLGHRLRTLGGFPHHGGQHLGLLIELEFNQSGVLAGAAVVFVACGTAVGEVVAAIGEGIGAAFLVEGDVHPHRLV